LEEIIRVASAKQRKENMNFGISVDFSEIFSEFKRKFKKVTEEEIDR
jgi:hypothetical protein